MAAPNSSVRPSTSGAGDLSDANLADLAPMHVDREDTMNPVKIKAVWSDMMAKAKLRTPGEKEQRAFRFAVYVYASINGTSREGSYSGTIVMNNGFEFAAAVIPQATGKMNIRKFFRGNANEAYDLLKGSGIIAADEVLVARAAELGINATEAFAMADYLSECTKFTPLEKIASAKAFTYGVDRAKRARGGRALESVEEARVNEQLATQGPEHNVEGKSVW